MLEAIIFGVKEEGKEYIRRPGVYAIIFNEQRNKIAVIKTDDGKYFLPGGGIENNETHVECLKREAMEEMGMAIEVGLMIGCAQRYFYSTNEYKYSLSEGYFYFCEMVEHIHGPQEPDHFLEWIEPMKAVDVLFHEHQSWVVEEALRQRRLK
jgi:8-oxo-dGTP diphosphatase